MILLIALLPVMLILGAVLGYVRAVSEADGIIERHIAEHRQSLPRETKKSVPITNPGPDWKVETKTEDWQRSMFGKLYYDYVAYAVRIDRKGSKPVLIGVVNTTDEDAEVKVRELVVLADSRCAFMNAQEIR